MVADARRSALASDSGSGDYFAVRNAFRSDGQVELMGAIFRVSRNSYEASGPSAFPPGHAATLRTPYPSSTLIACPAMGLVLPVGSASSQIPILSSGMYTHMSSMGDVKSSPHG
jgi:hypothetical protein